ncbi:hypothetical protein PHYPO_G00148780 [Pangasianodon hypophthalmus]|uniref:Ig-like domain-containing protein n=1 Tax=Pangasianodon hypophthalmus TaxID=310915 RepID=A0A5N5KA40_PANHP|nr:hypothetical protein PHYPO_G00148780 [Pangasianodon hypophthalmus]
MFVDVNGRYFVVFVFLMLINSVSAQSVQVVNANLGRSVILPCTANHDTLTAYWRYNDSKTVCDIIRGKVNFEEQDPVYKSRVESFPSKFAKGNFSIKLSNLKKSDAGIYTCNFPSTLTPGTVQLRVTENRTGDVMRRPDSLLLFLLGCVLLSN